MTASIRQEPPIPSARTVETPLVSVVTPFHNTGEYLDECIESVLSQTYTHWEYVLLDNCSTDDSAAIAERYANRDPRIRFIRATELLDQVPNYNRALTLISPESRYSKIVQADDWMFPTCLDEMVRIAQLNPAVGVVGSYSIYGDVLGHVGLPFSRTPVFTGRDAAGRFLMMDDGFLGSPTCVMYRSDLVRGRQPFFVEACDSYEDVDAVLALLEQSDFGFAFQVLTYNRRNNAGVWSRIESYAPVLLHLFILVQRYGRWALRDADFQQRFSQLSRRYYSMLASGRLGGKGKAFWAFHADSLRAAGIPLDRRQLRRALFEVTVDAAAHPVRTVRKVVARDPGHDRERPHVRCPGPFPMNPDISIVVCTRNRVDQLAATLRHYEGMHASVPWELVLVDNGSTDQTPALLRQFAASASMHVQLVTEPRSGASRGRNRGWRAAHGAVIAFADDDCYPRDDFIARLAGVYADPTIDYSGGRILLFDPSDYPITIIVDETRKLVAPNTLIEPGFIQGANMAIRRHVVERVGGFDEMLGAGTVYSCEDLDLLTRASFAGHTGVYDPSPVIFHHHRRQAGPQVQRLKDSYAVGRGAYYMKCALAPASRATTLRTLYWEARRTPFRMHLANMRRTAYESYGAARYLLHRLGRTLYRRP